MALKDLFALYGRVAFVMLVFAFVAAIIAGPLLNKSGFRSSVAVAQEHEPVPMLIRTRAVSGAGDPG